MHPPLATHVAAPYFVVYQLDHPLDESYLPVDKCPAKACTANLPRQTIPAGKYFVMGDNRTNSKDSRSFGPIPKSLIVGRAFIRPEGTLRELAAHLMRR